MISISVIICTFNRERTLRETISDVLNQDRPADQIIVVDQTTLHEPETNLLLASPSLTVVKLLQPNLPAARNAGLARATGDVVLFVDDDIRLKRDFLARVHAEFQSAAIDGFAPFVVSGPLASTAEFESQSSCVRGLQRGRRIRSVIGACMAYRREAVIDVGGFDPVMGRLHRAACGEDMEFSRRFSSRYRLWLKPSLGVLHHDDTPGGCEVRVPSGNVNRVDHQRALAYIVLKEENSLRRRTARAYLRLLRTFLIRRDRLAPRHWVSAIHEMNQVLSELDKLSAEVTSSMPGYRH